MSFDRIKVAYIVHQFWVIAVIFIEPLNFTGLKHLLLLSSLALTLHPWYMDKMLAPDGRKWWSPFNHSIRRFSPQLCKEASHPDLLGWSRCCPTSCLTRSSSLPIFHTKGLQKLLVYLSFLKAMLSLFNNTKTKLPCFTQFSNIKMGGGGGGVMPSFRGK